MITDVGLTIVTPVMARYMTLKNHGRKNLR